jgi:asparagine synthase (glutamine-hydrolysing)
MCGICGEVQYGDPGLVSSERVRAMAARLAHRGPDGEGLWHEPGIAMGHRRLSIIDLSEAASQPMTTPDGRYVIVYNGEIYNYMDVRSDLEAMGERFTTRSDTEVLLRAFVRWGLDALPRLNGMWAFAIWDRQKRELTLCRDRLGVKPLYWAQVPGGVVFASEISPLLLHPEVSRDIHPRALAEQVACRYVLAPRTLLKSVQKLPPGHVCTVTEKGTRIGHYWTLPLGERIRRIGEKEALERFSDLFESSVNRRLVSDVPVGLLLSGGVDSSALAAALKRSGHERMATFTVAFDAKGPFDERPYARAVAERFGTDHHETVITPEVFAGSLETVLSHQDDPVADMAVLPLYHVCALARDHVKVLLTGQGADELLGGYHLDRVLKQIRAIVRLRSLPGARKLAEWIGRRNPRRAYLLNWDEIRYAVPGQLPGKIRYDLTLPLQSGEMNALLKDCMPPPYDRTLDALYTEIPSHRGPLDAILATLMKSWLPDNLLNHGDRMSMAHGLELREPFLDPHLLDFCFHSPQRIKVARGETKRILKRYAVQAGVPRRVAYRRKRGFPVPWNDWIRGSLKNFVRETISSAGWMDSYFKRDGIDAAFNAHQNGEDKGLLLWNLTVLAHWGQSIADA